MSRGHKPLAWLYGEIQSPPFSTTARLEAGYLLRRLQRGEILAMPHSRPMPSVGLHCHELRVADRDHKWRIVYRVDAEAIILLAIFSKKTGKTPKRIVDQCKRRLKDYDYE